MALSREAQEGVLALGSLLGSLGDSYPVGQAEAKSSHSFEPGAPRVTL